MKKILSILLVAAMTAVSATELDIKPVSPYFTTKGSSYGLSWRASEPFNEMTYVRLLHAAEQLQQHAEMRDFGYYHIYVLHSKESKAVADSVEALVPLLTEIRRVKLGDLSLTPGAFAIVVHHESEAPALVAGFARQCILQANLK